MVFFLFMGRGVILGLMREVTIYYVNHTLTFYFRDFCVMMMNKQLINFFLRFPQSCPLPPLKKKNRSIVDLQCCIHFRHMQSDSVTHIYTFFFKLFSTLGY